MSKFELRKPIIHQPTPLEYEISSLALKRLVLATYPDIQLYRWDRNYYYIGHEDWGKVFKDVLLNMPKYAADRWDCEQYALLATARVGSKYKLNTCGIAIGLSPWGEHGYNLFVSLVDDYPELFICEPQNGMIYSVGEDSGYVPRLAIFG